jgi:hypothetical protein
MFKEFQQAPTKKESVFEDTPFFCCNVVAMIAPGLNM